MARSAPKTLLLSPQVLNAVISLPACPNTHPPSLQALLPILLSGVAKSPHAHREAAAPLQ